MWFYEDSGGELKSVQVFFFFCKWSAWLGWGLGRRVEINCGKLISQYLLKEKGGLANVSPNPACWWYGHAVEGPLILRCEDPQCSAQHGLTTTLCHRIAVVELATLLCTSEIVSFFRSGSKCPLFYSHSAVPHKEDWTTQPMIPALNTFSPLAHDLGQSEKRNESQ